ncbi:MAG: FKBP-type peptidyl-prolyl cis-trans isomerase [Candidatus Endonucleobacter sp. (ex Gigantidas childressi)]|nr:FKBP-type peptidyl-prolyl cis-trans isomerase [Candidatus Endonucleobacter sp. (ex Gigantidas childressi)]
MSNVSITQGSKVSLHFSLMLEDGAIVNSNFGQSPASLIIGDGSLPQGFETVLMGLSVGDKKKVMVLPEQAFGMRNTSNIQNISRTAFKDDIALEEGLIVSFSDAANSELPGVIHRIGEQSIEVDFNHPLAGHHLQFEVEILEIGLN